MPRGWDPARGDGCRVEVIDIAFVPGGYADTAHTLIEGGTLGEQVAHTEDGIRSEAGICSVLRIEGMARDEYRKQHGKYLTYSSFQHNRP